MLDLCNILLELARTRPIFHSEADFQHALAWEIHKKYPDDASLRLEFRPPSLGKKAYVDIWVRRSASTVVIELKYKTKGTKINFNNEVFDLLNQGAQDIGRYDFLKDIERLEKIVLNNDNAIGYGIFLTNDSLYWKQIGEDLQTVDVAFRINPRRIISGKLLWGTHASKGTIKNREDPIFLRGEYEIAWNDYSNLNDARFGHFRYLLLTVKLARSP